MPPIRAARLLTETAHGASNCLNRRRSLIRESIHWVACEASHYNCKASRSALFGLRGSLRVALDTQIRFAIRFARAVFHRRHGSRRGSRDRSRDRRGAPARAQHCSGFRDSGMAGRHPLPGFGRRGLGARCRDRAEWRDRGGVWRRSRPVGDDYAPDRGLRRGARDTDLPDQQRRPFRLGRARYARCQDLAGESRRQSQGAGVPDSGLRQGPAGSRLRAMSSTSSTRRSCGSTPSISPTRLPNPLCGLPRKPWRRRLPRGSG